MFDPPRVEFSVETRGLGTAVPVVVVHGEVDLATSGELGQEVARVLDKGPDQLVFDVADMSFMDCAGLRVIACALRRLPGPGQVVVREPRPIVRRLLALTSLDERCVIEP